VVSCGLPTKKSKDLHPLRCAAKLNLPQTSGGLAYQASALSALLCGASGGACSYQRHYCSVSYYALASLLLSALQASTQLDFYSTSDLQSNSYPTASSAFCCDAAYSFASSLPKASHKPCRRSPSCSSQEDRKDLNCELNG